jgi:hypothetical protein
MGMPPPVPAQPRKKRHIVRWVLLPIVAVTIIGAIAGPKDDKSHTSTTPVTASTTGSSGVIGQGDEIDDVTLTTCEPASGGTLVKAGGTLVNNSSKTSDYTIDISYVSGDGTVLDSNGFAFVQNLPAAGRAEWDTSFFRAPEPGASFKVTEVERTASL